MKYTSLKIDASFLQLEKTKELHSEIISFITDLGLDKTNIAKVECYVSMSTQEELSSCQSTFQEALKLSFGAQLPANTLIDQQVTDTEGKAVLKLTIIDSASASIVYKEYQKHPYTIVNINNEKFLFSGGIMFASENDVLRSIQLAYDFAEQLLDNEEMHMGHLALISNYIEDLQGQNKAASTGWDNLKTLDEVRSLYFDPTLFKHGYPLLLNNSIRYGSFCISFIAASQDGFPSAQYFSTNTKPTQSCYLPGLKKAFIGNLGNEPTESVDEQIQRYKTILSEILQNACADKELVIEELKLMVADTSLSATIAKALNAQLNAVKTTVIQVDEMPTNCKFDIEAFAAVSG